MIYRTFKFGNTEILIDDTYLPKSEEERQQRYEQFNRIGCEILYSKDKEV